MDDEITDTERIALHTLKSTAWKRIFALIKEEGDYYVTLSDWRLPRGLPNVEIVLRADGTWSFV